MEQSPFCISVCGLRAAWRTAKTCETTDFLLPARRRDVVAAGPHLVTELFEDLFSLLDEGGDLAGPRARPVTRLRAEVVDEFHDPGAVDVAGDHGEIGCTLTVVAKAQREPNGPVLGSACSQLREELFHLV